MVFTIILLPGILIISIYHLHKTNNNMGNCSIKSLAAAVAASNKNQTFIRIMMESGRVIVMKGPKLAQEILDQFPGYGIYQKGHLSLPLFDNELLIDGQFYYLLPFGGLVSTTTTISFPAVNVESSSNINDEYEYEYEFNSSSRKEVNNSAAAFEVLPSKANGSVWRVKMVIDSKELEEMLSENAEALIMRMRSVAKSSDKSPERSFRLKTMDLIANGLRSPITSRKFAAC